MSQMEFLLWRVEYCRNPWGDDWKQAGTIAAAALVPWSKRRIDPEDFIPRIKPRQTAEQIERQMMAWAKTSGLVKHGG